MARDLSQQLITHGEVKRGILGIRGTEMNADLAKSLKLMPNAVLLSVKYWRALPQLKRYKQVMSLL